MASPASAAAVDMFKGQAERAAAALMRATRAAKKAASATQGADDSLPSRPIDWQGMSASAWKRFGALSAFRMRNSGTVLFTEGRDVVREATVDGRDRIMVQLLGVAADVVTPVSVEQLLVNSDGVLPGVLSFDGRRGAAVPHLHVQGQTDMPATITPHRDKPVAGGGTVNEQGRLAGLAPPGRHGSVRAALGAATEADGDGGALRLDDGGGSEAPDGDVHVAS
eukprot:1909558-Pleurochrysis_carterae.AAC.1